MHDEVHARRGGLVDPHGELHGGGTEPLGEDLAEALAHAGVVAVAREIDEHRDVAPVAVGTDDRAHRAALAGVHRRLGHRTELVDVGVEELVARVALEGVHQRSSGVRAGVVAARAQHRGSALAQQRDPGQRLGVRRRGEEPEEAALAGHLAVGAEGLDAHVVEVRRAVHGRAGVGLGQDQQGALARLGLDRVGQPGERLGERLVGAQDAQAGAGHGAQRLALLAVAVGRHVLEDVLAVAQEGEVLVGQPLQQLRTLADLVGVERRRIAAQLGDHVEHPLPSARPVLDRLAHVAQHGLDPLDDRLGVVAVTDPVDLDVHPGLAHRVARGLDRTVVDDADVLQGAGDVAADVEVGVHDQVHIAQLAAQLHRERVHQEGHVVGDDLDHAVPAGRPAVLGQRRGEDAHPGGALRARPGEPEVAGQCAVDVHVGAPGEVLGRDVAVVGAEQVTHLGVRRAAGSPARQGQVGRLREQVGLVVVRRR
ncbi:unannotated protein [freshwater metagenome]|uniref:Unannotated protein n=1 Tax=freshwater metagenome TaxID=449393 RepID=A0A6J6P428_9ZZZZ